MTWTTPRTWVASEVVTAAIMNTHVRDNLLALQDRLQIVRKPSDTNIISNATPTNDPDLKFTAVAGQTYVGLFDVMATCTLNTIDVQIGFSFPTGTLTYDVIGPDPAATTTIAQTLWSSNIAATSGAAGPAFGAINGNVHGLIAMTYVCTTGGTVNLQLSQGTLTATNLTIKAGSFMFAARQAV